ncbi:hypothetical protein GCM10027299_57990 [Larkinella ripae]
MAMGLFLAVLALAGSGGTAYWLWTTGQPPAFLWVALTLELTVLVAGTSFALLILGENPERLAAS